VVAGVDNEDAVDVCRPVKVKTNKGKKSEYLVAKGKAR
jgi:hypothetical protein